MFTSEDERLDFIESLVNKLVSNRSLKMTCFLNLTNGFVYAMHNSVKSQNSDPFNVSAITMPWIDYGLQKLFTEQLSASSLETLTMSN